MRAMTEPERAPGAHLLSLTAALSLAFSLATARAIDFPGPDPGEAHGRVDGGRAILENSILSCEWSMADGRLRPVSFEDKIARTRLDLTASECFALQIERTPSPTAMPILASGLRMDGAAKVRKMEPRPASPRLAERSPGIAIELTFLSSDERLRVGWRAILRDGANAVRQEISLTAVSAGLEVAGLTLVDLSVPTAQSIGVVDGSPVGAGTLFAALEHPMSRNEIQPAGPGKTRVRCFYPYNITMSPGVPQAFRSILGVASEGQSRRAFLYYLERERARPYHTFLHYNCGYELGCRFWQLRNRGTPEEFEQFLAGQEAAWLDRIHIFGRELVEKRGVTIDSFVHDHGWDDTEKVWQFHKGFPGGLAKVSRAAAGYRSAVGMWYSPWGGYSGRARRMEAGQKQGFETSKLGLSLAGPRYFERFRDACVGMVRDFGVNYFKYDGFAAGNSLAGAGAYPGEVEALLRLCEELRSLKPDVFLNPTTGTWPSPFWMLWADAIWRQESDAGFLGKGSDRQQWITYRDNATYHATIKRGPLCPISSLMLHGIMIHKMAFKNPYDPKNQGVSRGPKDVLDEIRSYFATGTCMQELHIDPSLMTDAQWDALAEAAKWSRSNADVLADTHWVGGDPSKGEIYGWAAWSPRKGILSLRNPSDQPASIAIDMAAAFELPAGAARAYVLKSPWKEEGTKASIRAAAGQARSFELQPFEVMVLDAEPESSATSAGAPDLVAHWTFNEADGDVARDVTGNGHDAKVKNTQWIRSPRGHALRFDSKEDLARYGGIESMNLIGDASLAVWVRLDSAVAPDTNRLIFGDGGGGIDRNLNLRLDGSGGLRFEWANGKESSSLVAPGALMNGTWKHIVVVADAHARTMTIYVDGERVARADEARPLGRAPVKERTTGWFYNGFFQGDLDDIRIYGRALSEDQVRQLFASEADVQVGAVGVKLDASGGEPRGTLTATFRNLSREPRTVRLGPGQGAAKEFVLAAGQRRDLSLCDVTLSRVWPERNDLLLCEKGHPTPISVRAGDTWDEMRSSVPANLLLEPMSVHIRDPWHSDMATEPKGQIEFDVGLAIAPDQSEKGILRLTLTSKETGKEVAHRELKAPKPRQTLAFDVAGLPWGAYELTARFIDATGKPWVGISSQATVLPGGAQRIQILNNLVTELMDASARGLIGQDKLAFMNPRDGWVWFRAAGPCGLKLSDDEILAPSQGHGAREAMRLLPAGKHVIQITGKPTGLWIRAVPALVYNIYPSSPMIPPFGANTWDRLRKHMLPNCNMIESGTVDTEEYKEWLAQGKKWLANVQAPGLIDDKGWPMERLLDLWLNPGKSTAHAERPGLDIAKLSGVQVDEYYPGAKSVCGELAKAMALSVARLSREPAFANKFWIPFFSGKYGALDPLFMKVLIGSGWPFSEEVYVGEMPTEAENVKIITARFLDVARSYEAAQPGAVRRMIFTPMYAYLPYCTANRCPGANFHIHLQMQMQLLASDPAFFGLWGVQPYRSNYVDEETLACMGRLLRHYCIEGHQTPLFDGPYELRHVADPDFEEGMTHWGTDAAGEESIFAGSLADYGELQGRYPASAFGDTFACMRRCANKANVISQRLVGLDAGKCYSVKMITGDHGDLKAGRSRRENGALSIAVDGADVLPGAFSHSFRSGSRGPKGFSAETPFWMTYHWLRFRAKEATAHLRISDWGKPNEPVGPVGQETMISFVEVQPVLIE